ncbi:MAG TPA: prepilin-type N-terminal cleavage/methylation domain-containing protein [Candidatus Paceibacterota bacterium]|nr:prepilin-type N-terminal cleavage/methylation domain-containing protein [Candidatus Paceibacterota bacterium]
MGNIEHRTPNAERRRDFRVGILQCSMFNVQRSRFSGSRQAFTLVELMVVVALIGIMTAMIIPEMRGTYEDALLRSTSRELLNAFSIAHSRAISFNQPHRLHFNCVTGEYTIEKLVRERGHEDFAPVEDVSGSSGKLDSRVTVEFRLPGEGFSDEANPAPASREVISDDAITFFSDGTADAKEVLLQDRQGFRLVLRVNPTTSNVRIVEPPKQ